MTAREHGEMLTAALQLSLLVSGVRCTLSPLLASLPSFLPLFHGDVFLWCCDPLILPMHIALLLLLAALTVLFSLTCRATPLEPGDAPEKYSQKLYEDCLNRHVSALPVGISISHEPFTTLLAQVLAVVRRRCSSKPTGRQLQRI